MMGCMDTLIGIINAHMYGHPSEPGEYVDWSAPDYMTRAEWRDFLGVPVEVFAADNPHMIVWED